MRSSILFHIKFLPILKILFVYLEWLKILKGPQEKHSPIVTPSHILFTYSDFLFLLYLPIRKISCVYSLND